MANFNTTTQIFFYQITGSASSTGSASDFNPYVSESNAYLETIDDAKLVSYSTAVSPGIPANLITTIVTKD